MKVRKFLYLDFEFNETKEEYMNIVCCNASDDKENRQSCTPTTFFLHDQELCNTRDKESQSDCGNG